MDFTVGDVLFLFVAIFGGLTAAWAGSVLAAILFPERTHRASMSFEDHPWLTFVIGLVTLVPLALICFALFSRPFTLPFGFLMMLALLGTAVLGSGGLARLVARRIDDQGGAASSFQAITKGAALIFIAEFLPVFGWLFVFPYVLIASFGAGIKSFFKKRAVVQAPAPTEAK